MKAFVKTDDFKNLNVGHVMDEGRTSELKEYLLFYGERTIWSTVLRLHLKPSFG